MVFNRQNRALPGWCGILDWLISEVAEECPENKDGVDSVSTAPPTPPQQHAAKTTHGCDRYE
jgi:hypothetical protein